MPRSDPWARARAVFGKRLVRKTIQELGGDNALSFFAALQAGLAAQMGTWRFADLVEYAGELAKDSKGYAPPEIARQLDRWSVKAAALYARNRIAKREAILQRRKNVEGD